jgi:hypothetical protein
VSSSPRFISENRFCSIFISSPAFSHPSPLGKPYRMDSPVLLPPASFLAGQVLCCKFVFIIPHLTLLVNGHCIIKFGLSSGFKLRLGLDHHLAVQLQLPYSRPFPRSRPWEDRRFHEYISDVIKFHHRPVQTLDALRARML